MAPAKPKLSRSRSADGERTSRRGARGDASGPAEDAIFERIYDAVLDHRLQPGTKLKEVALAQAFGVNRAVIRKVLARLSYNRLVSLRPNRGAVVASPSVDESRDLFAARRVVEAAIVECVARKVSRADVKALRTHAQQERDAYERGDTRRGSKLSIEFHRELARLAGNGVLGEFLDQLIARTPLVVLAHKASSGDSACSDDEHTEIVDAIARGDAAGAVAAMNAHLSSLEGQLDLTEVPLAAPDFAAIFAVSEA
jgi:DNA-binding GntR family transcriptional regulator